MKKISQSPITFVISVVFGAIVGFYLPGIIPILNPINSVYGSFLQVCSLPVIICIITINIGKVFQKSFRSILKKAILLSIVMMIVSAVIGVVVSAGTTDFLTPSDQVKVTLSKISDDTNEKDIIDSFSELKAYTDNDISNERKFSFVEFLVDTVPENVFTALSEDSLIQIAIFFSIFGVMLTLIEKKYSEPIIDLFNGINSALCKFISAILVFLPVSVFIAVASLFSNGGMLNILGSIIDFIIVNYIGLIVLILLSFIVITICTKCSLKKHLQAIKQTLFVSIATSSRPAVVPIAIEDSIKRMGLDETTVNSVIPITTLLCPNGKILSSAILAVYAIIIYGTSKDISTLFLIIISAILFAISTAGVSGAASVAMLSLLLQPLGLPTDLISIVLVVTFQFYQGISTFADVYSNLTIIALAQPNKKERLKKDSQVLERVAQNVT